MNIKVCLVTALAVVSVRANGYGGVLGGGGGGDYSGLGQFGTALSGGADYSGGNSLGSGGLIAGQPFLAGTKTSCFGCDQDGAGGFGYGGGHGGGGGGGYGGYGGGAYGGVGGGGLSENSLGALPILRTSNKVDFVSVPHSAPQSSGHVTPLVVNSHQNPISLVYRSFGAPVNIIQKHIPAPGTFKQSQSEEEPHRHLHTVTKPVIQEVREIISPYRIVRQEIRPVQENIQTIVAKAVSANGGGGGGGAGGFSAGGNGGGYGGGGNGRAY